MDAKTLNFTMRTYFKHHVNCLMYHVLIAHLFLRVTVALNFIKPVTHRLAEHYIKLTQKRKSTSHKVGPL